MIDEDGDEHKMMKKKLTKNTDPKMDSFAEAKMLWKQLPAATRSRIAREEHVNNEQEKLFKIYLKALLLEAENIH